MASMLLAALGGLATAQFDADYFPPTFPDSGTELCRVGEICPWRLRRQVDVAGVHWEWQAQADAAVCDCTVGEGVALSLTGSAECRDGFARVGPRCDGCCAADLAACGEGLLRRDDCTCGACPWGEVLVASPVEFATSPAQPDSVGSGSDSGASDTSDSGDVAAGSDSGAANADGSDAGQGSPAEPGSTGSAGSSEGGVEVGSGSGAGSGSVVASESGSDSGAGTDGGEGSGGGTDEGAGSGVGTDGGEGSVVGTDAAEGSGSAPAETANSTETGDGSGSAGNGAGSGSGESEGQSSTSTVVRTTPPPPVGCAVCTGCPYPVIIACVDPLPEGAVNSAGRCMYCADGYVPNAAADACSPAVMLAGETASCAPGQAVRCGQCLGARPVEGRAVRSAGLVIALATTMRLIV